LISNDEVAQFVALASERLVGMPALMDL